MLLSGHGSNAVGHLNILTPCPYAPIRSWQQHRGSPWASSSPHFSLQAGKPPQLDLDHAAYVSYIELVPLASHRKQTPAAYVISIRHQHTSSYVIRGTLGPSFGMPVTHTLTLSRAPCGLYGVKCIGLVPLASHCRQTPAAVAEEQTPRHDVAAGLREGRVHWVDHPFVLVRRPANGTAPWSIDFSLFKFKFSVI